MTLIQRPLLSLAVCLLALLGADTAGAQLLPQDVKIAEGTLTAEQQDTVAEFVDAWMARLIDGEQKEITDARAAFLREFATPGITDTFKDAFSTAISARMGEAIASDSDLVRINAMIVATKLTNAEAENFIDEGLADDNAAVQYWSAKAYLERVERENSDGNTMPGAEQRRVIEKVQQIFENNPSVPVAGVGFRILDKLTVSEGRAAILALLNDRTAAHVGKPQESYVAEQTAITLLLQKIARERESDAGDVRETARAAFRYFVLVNQQLDQGNVLDSVKPGHQSMLDLCHNALINMAAKLGATTPPDTEEVNDWIKLNNWTSLLEIAEVWRGILTGAPFEIDAADL